MDVRRFLDRVRAGSGYRGQVVHHRRLPARPARHQDPARPLEPRLLAYLERQGIARLYTHQAQAVDAARAGKNVRRHRHRQRQNATGNLPVIETLLRHPRAGAHLFPTKPWRRTSWEAARVPPAPAPAPGTYETAIPRRTCAQ